jgi:hypothetical protein
VYILDASFEVNCSQMLHACVGSHIDPSSLSQLSGSFPSLLPAFENDVKFLNDEIKRNLSNITF